MSRVDDELAQAVAESEAAAPAVEPMVSPVPAPERRPKRNLGLLLALVAMGGGILGLVLTSFEDAAVYSRGVEQLLQESEKLTGRNVRVEGTLVKGSLTRRDKPCEYRFTIQRKGANLDVRYPQCVVPDTFRDVPGMDVAVTAEGTLNAAGHFEATNLMAKCPSKYEMNNRAKSGELAPHAATVGSAMPATTEGMGYPAVVAESATK